MSVGLDVDSADITALWNKVSKIDAHFKIKRKNIYK
jgi:hypothetical protein